MNYYAFHIGDYASATAHLTPLEDIAYRRLLDRYYMGERALTSDLADLCRLTRMQSECERIAVAVVVKEFFLCEDGKLISIRAEKELAAFAGKSSKAKASAKARWDKEKTDANALRTQSEGNAPNNQEPIPRTNKEKKRTSAPVILVSLSDLQKDGLNETLANEWLEHRKRKKANLTMRAWDSIKAEAVAARYSPAQAVAKALDRGWTSFEAAWVTGNGSAIVAKPETGVTYLKAGEF